MVYMQLEVVFIKMVVLAMEEFIKKLTDRLKEAKFPITDLKQGVVINGSQQTDDAVLYNRIIEIVNELAEECGNDFCE